MKKKQSIRETIEFYIIDCKTTLGKSIDFFIILLNFLILAIFVAETYHLSESTISILWKTEIVIVFFFVIEYIARLYGSPSRWKQVVNIYSIIDLITILPTLVILFFPGASASIVVLKILRVFRALRIFRFLRFVQSPHFFFGTMTLMLLRISRLTLTIFTIFFVSSGLFYQAENLINPQVNNFGDAFYYTVVALTTTGFGDIVPLSGAGRLVTVLTIISGIVFIPWQASQIIKAWIRRDKMRKPCKKCGLILHDTDASHCKACGNIIYQEVEGSGHK